MELKLLLELAVQRDKCVFFKREKETLEFTGDVVGINLLSQIIQVRKCTGFVALHCGHKIFVLNEQKKKDLLKLNSLMFFFRNLILNINSMLIFG
jgi:hypothetical protein